jgi:hypothetical protein
MWGPTWKIKQKRAAGVAQVVVQEQDPEFKPQYLKKKENGHSVVHHLLS